MSTPRTTPSLTCRSARIALVWLAAFLPGAWSASAATVTVIADNRGGTIKAFDGIGTPQEVGFDNLGPGEFMMPLDFNQCVSDNGRIACTSSSSAWLDPGPGNTTTGFSITSTMSAIKPFGNGWAIAQQGAFLHFVVSDAGAGVPFLFSGYITVENVDISIKLSGPGVEIVFDGDATWQHAITLTNGLYILTVDALALAGDAASAFKEISFQVNLESAAAACGPGAGSCFAAHASAGCSDSDCCAAVCGADPACCAIEWDQQCVLGTGVCDVRPLTNAIIDPTSGHLYGLLSPAPFEFAALYASWIGWHLVSVETAAENQFLRCHIFDNVPGATPMGGLIGLNDIASEGSFVWTSGDPIGFTRWAPGKPDNLDDEDAVEMDSSGFWNDIDQDVARFSAVELDQFPICGPGTGSCFSTHAAGCDDESCCHTICSVVFHCCTQLWDATCVGWAEALCSPAILSGPIFNPDTGHHYYLLDTCAWTEAEEKAMSLNGHLVTIDDAQENAWVYANVVSAGDASRRCFIGLHDQGVEGTFQWIDNSAATYANWAPGEPNNLGGEDFVEMGGPFGATWNDVNLIGAVSFTSHAVVEVPCLGDVDGNFTVDAADLGQLLAAWNTGSKLADLNQDGIVDASDLGLLLAGWGPCG